MNCHGILKLVLDMMVDQLQNCCRAVMCSESMLMYSISFSMSLEIGDKRIGRKELLCIMGFLV